MMATLKRTTAQLEIAFWSCMIPLMRASSLVQACLPSALALIDRQKNLHGRFAANWRAHPASFVKILAWSCAGLILGLILGYVKVRLG
jgi:hypothetical protein